MFPSREELKYAGFELRIRRLAAELDQMMRPVLLARLAGDIRIVVGAGRDTPARNESE
ncbi:hypothetical protein MXD62_16670 [Frankia sp. Mgl5]|uniref:hypothetical protein n=1 Tax=Frankia sp. Mgl5 TaxID=2933793 RepID=UPI00200D2EE3|nr:hypothetical protein [Frankia sp. Mgl5]MCK9928790.1 hypothetical protein [Frankia sp. Mgl5]